MQKNKQLTYAYIVEGCIKFGTTKQLFNKKSDNSRNGTHRSSLPNVQYVFLSDISEKVLHKKFAQYKYRTSTGGTEFYHYSPEIDEFIKSNITKSASTVLEVGFEEYKKWFSSEIRDQIQSIKLGVSIDDTQDR